MKLFQRLNFLMLILLTSNFTLFSEGEVERTHEPVRTQEGEAQREAEAQKAADAKKAQQEAEEEKTQQEAEAQKTAQQAQQTPTDSSSDPKTPSQTPEQSTDKTPTFKFEEPTSEAQTEAKAAARDQAAARSQAKAAEKASTFDISFGSDATSNPQEPSASSTLPKDLSKIEISKITTDQIKSLSKEQIKSLLENPNIESVTEEQLQAIPAKNLAEAIVGTLADKVKSLFNKNKISDDFVSKLSPEQAKALIDAHNSTWTSTISHRFESDQVDYLKELAKTVGKPNEYTKVHDNFLIETNKITTLTADQFKNLTPKQVENLSSEQIKNLTEDVVFNKDDKKNLFSKLLNNPNIGDLSENIVKKINPEYLVTEFTQLYIWDTSDKITNKVLATEDLLGSKFKLPNEFVEKLTPEQAKALIDAHEESFKRTIRVYFTSDQIDYLKTLADAVNKPDLAKSTKDDFIEKNKTKSASSSKQTDVTDKTTSPDKDSSDNSKPTPTSTDATAKPAATSSTLPKDLSKVDITKITPEQIKSLTPEQIKSLLENPKIESLTEEQLQAIPADKLAQAIVGTLADKVKSLFNKNKISDDFVSKLSPEQAKALIDAHNSTWTSTISHRFESDQVDYLKELAKTVGKPNEYTKVHDNFLIETNKITTLTADQFKNLTPKQVENLSSEQIKNLTEDVVFNKDDKKNLFSKLLNNPNIGDLSENIVKKINPEYLVTEFTQLYIWDTSDKITNKVLATEDLLGSKFKLPNEFVEKLTPEQAKALIDAHEESFKRTIRVYFTSDQIDYLKTLADAVNKPDLAKSTKDDFIEKNKTKSASSSKQTDVIDKTTSPDKNSSADSKPTPTSTDATANPTTTSSDANKTPTDATASKNPPTNKPEKTPEPTANENTKISTTDKSATDDKNNSNDSKSTTASTDENTNESESPDQVFLSKINKVATFEDLEKIINNLDNTNISKNISDQIFEKIINLVEKAKLLGQDKLNTLRQEIESSNPKSPILNVISQVKFMTSYVNFDDRKVNLNSEHLKKQLANMPEKTLNLIVEKSKSNLLKEWAKKELKERFNVHNLK